MNARSKTALLAVPVVAALALIGVVAIGADKEKKMLPEPTATYAPDKAAKPGELKTAIVAGGCFWCVEGVFDLVDGVKEAVSGYAGGTKETANYEAVCSKKTGHAEAVKITYDPSKISYGEVLRIFFVTHDPTTKDRQGNDVGPQYRSAIFPLDDEQKAVAEAYIKQLNEAKAFPNPVVTTVEPLKADAFYNAEGYHQDYVKCNPRQSYIQYVAMPKIDKLKEKFPEKVKKEEATPDKK